jgi:hypothetical protein
MVRPGGYLVISDSVDLGTPASPHLEYRETVTGMWHYLGGIIGTDVDYGLRHRAGFVGAGLHSVVAAVTWPEVAYGSPLTTFIELTLQQVLPRMLADGFVAPDVAQKALDYLASPRLCDQSFAMITTQGRAQHP